MSKQDPAEQVRFLVSCIGHTTNGRPDFTLVAQELGIVTKAAAQKRYERMLKANGVSASSKASSKASADDDVTTPASTPVKRKPAAGDAGSAKKKAKGTKKEESDDDMKDVKPVVRARAPRTPKKEVKKEPKEEPASPASVHRKLLGFGNIYGLVGERLSAIFGRHEAA
ncbi:hypothetical protein BBK36DRAFT_1196904 [Trichoderma citrinoviride]|uniref:Myb-like DNA-binding domain-containing protein n=1 Tax=Trichoderma citrinoviride TaxID=58853 RepID=A0A2T4BDV4_9HYPO|nr:hypothetical protein BBK36DRAFT_1196904 [Trichoderma citrinoviride]PTB67504.1 hypothetical protein BBK36DRAFT_1196904 [Trichoderma citrinoviride]